MSNQSRDYAPEEGQVREEQSGVCGDIASMDTHGGGIGSKGRWGRVGIAEEVQSNDTNIVGGGSGSDMDTHGGGIGSKG